MEKKDLILKKLEEKENKNHIQRHKELHAMLDELVADFISDKKIILLNDISVMELMEWSYSQTIQPDSIQEKRNE